MIIRNLFDNTVFVQASKIAFDICNNLFFGFLFKNYLATEWGILESFFYFCENITRVSSDE